MIGLGVLDFPLDGQFRFAISDQNALSLNLMFGCVDSLASVPVVCREIDRSPSIEICTRVTLSSLRPATMGPTIRRIEQQIVHELPFPPHSTKEIGGLNISFSLIDMATGR